MTAKEKWPSRYPSPIMNRLTKQFARVFEADFNAAKPQGDRRSSGQGQDPADTNTHQQTLLEAFDGFSASYATCAQWAPKDKQSGSC